MKSLKLSRSSSRLVTQVTKSPVRQVIGQSILAFFLLFFFQSVMTDFLKKQSKKSVMTYF